MGMRTCGNRVVGVLLVLIVAGCRSAEDRPRVQARSLLGDELVAPPLDPGVHTRRLEQYEAAESRAASRPDDVEAQIWVGRRLAYVGRFQEAIAVYTKTLGRHPDSAALLRHRGHRYITVRRFSDAIVDLEKARGLVAGTPDEVEPDGLPNASNVPIGTLQSNIRYHLGLAYYLRGEFERAAVVFREALESATNDDRWCSESYWLYLALRRANHAVDAGALLPPISRDMQLVENHAYQRLLLMFRGEESPNAVLAGARASADANAFATLAYGVGIWKLLGGDRDGAREIFEEIVSSENWPAFGHIAAEAELVRMKGR